MTSKTWHRGETWINDRCRIRPPSTELRRANVTLVPLWEKYRTGAQGRFGEVKGLRGRAGALLSLLDYLGRHDRQEACMASGCPGRGMSRR